LVAKETAVVATRLLDELKERLTSAYGDRLHAVVLFGSEARGEAGPDSDIDVLRIARSMAPPHRSSG
jgi:predicted nucleotidyltransferase